MSIAPHPIDAYLQEKFPMLRRAQTSDVNSLQLGAQLEVAFMHIKPVPCSVVVFFRHSEDRIQLYSPHGRLIVLPHIAKQEGAYGVAYDYGLQPCRHGHWNPNYLAITGGTNELTDYGLVVATKFQKLVATHRNIFCDTP